MVHVVELDVVGFGGGVGHGAVRRGAGGGQERGLAEVEAGLEEGMCLFGGLNCGGGRWVEVRESR